MFVGEKTKTTENRGNKPQEEKRYLKIEFLEITDKYVSTSVEGYCSQFLKEQAIVTIAKNLSEEYGVPWQIILLNIASDDII